MMRRRVVVRFLVFVLGVSLLASLIGCLNPFRINGCGSGPGSDPRDWFGRPPLTLCMEATGGSGVSVLITWDFGDGTTATGHEVTHTYTEPGEYEVVAEMLYDDGSMDRDTTTVAVAGEPEAAFTYQVYDASQSQSFFSWLPSLLTGSSAGGNELEIQFNATSSYPGETSVKYRPAQLRWNFGDGAQETVEVKTGWGWLGSSSMTIRHEYAAAGTYVVTMMLTDTLGYTDTTTQTISVGTPGGVDDDEDLDEGFDVGAITWEPGDEEEEEGDCIFIEGTVQNNASVPAGVELTATAYNATGNPVGTFTYWPAGATNIAVGVNYAYGFFLCDLSIPGTQVVTVEVRVTDAIVY